MSAPTGREVLAVPMPENDASAPTIGEYLYELLSTLWAEDEGFSGKRPFGNSGWQYDVYAALIAAGLVDGVLDEDGYVEEFDAVETADHLIQLAIAAAFGVEGL